MHSFVLASSLFALSAFALPQDTGAGMPAGAFSASFTEYGSHDDGGSSTCNSDSASCGFYNNPGFNAAVSQNLFGASSGVGSGCRKCYQLTVQQGTSGQPLPGSQSIVVMVNNLCPAASNQQWCSQTGPGMVNSAGASAHFDLCQDDGAAAALFGPSGAGAGTGYAVEVDCSQWSGSAPMMLF